MADREIVYDIDKHIEQLGKLKQLLTRLHEDPNFGNMMIKPGIAMLITATQYLSDNLTELKQRYLS